MSGLGESGNSKTADLQKLFVDWLARMTPLFYFRISHLVLVVTFFLGVLAGALLTTPIPGTLFTQPSLTWKVMKAFPVGSAVLPKNTPQARDQFEQVGWWQEPAIVVGYETITYKNEVVMVCQVRTHQGQGVILSVNPTWLELVQTEKTDRGS
jgi:hypothetical protein